jgi:type I restriction enzyme S subunit
MSWKKAKLGEILTESRIPSEAPDPDRRIKVKLKVLGVEKRGIENEIEGATKQFVRKAGQFIYGKQNFHKGAFGIIPEQLDGYESSADLPAFDVSDKCLPEWIFYYFKQGNYYLELSKIARGVATQRIHPEQIYDLEIPLPDIRTQNEVLAKIKSLENNGDELKSELTHQLTLVKKLRQQLLQDAVQGKLVEQNKKDEPASELLKKIKAEKAKLIAEKKLKKEKELPPIKPEEIPFEIPENWVWCRLGEICTKITDGFHNTPPKVSEGFPYIAATQVKSDQIDWDNCHYVDEKYHRELYLKASPQKGELLVVNIGAGCGTPAIIDVNFEFSFKNTAILKFNQSLISNKLLFYYFLSRKEEIYAELTKGGLQPFLSLKILNEIDFPLPPLSEQNRIVQKLDELMQYCNELEASIKESESQNEKLLQQVLREALRPASKRQKATI